MRDDRMKNYTLLENTPACDGVHAKVVGSVQDMFCMNTCDLSHPLAGQEYNSLRYLVRFQKRRRHV